MNHHRWSRFAGWYLRFNALGLCLVEACLRAVCGVLGERSGDGRLECLFHCSHLPLFPFGLLFPGAAWGWKSVHFDRCVGGGGGH